MKRSRLVLQSAVIVRLLRLFNCIIELSKVQKLRADRLATHRNMRVREG